MEHMKIYVISLQEAGEKRADLAEALSAQSLSFQVIDAVDARQWQSEALAKHISSFGVACNMTHTPKPGAIGCHLSHLKAYQKLIDSDAPAAIILEDDAIITPELRQHMPCLQQASAIFDIIFLCDRRPNRPAPVIGTSERGLQFCFKKYSNIGTTGYVITRQAASYMLAHHTPFRLAIDTLLNRWWQTKLKVATTAPQLVRDDAMASSIGYHDLAMFRNPIWRIANLITKAKMSAMKRLTYQRMYHAMKANFKKKMGRP